MENMRYYELVEDGFIVEYGTGGQKGQEITRARYEAIVNSFKNAPLDTETMESRLTVNIDFVMVEKQKEDEEPTPDEILAILLGEGDEE